MAWSRAGHCGASASSAAGLRPFRGPIPRLDSSGFSRETACAQRSEISLKAAVAVLRANPTPQKEGPCVLPAVGNMKMRSEQSPRSRTGGAGAPEFPRPGVSEHLFQAGGSDAMGSFPPWMTASRRAEGPEL